MIRIKRVFEPPAKEDGFRILVDRLWPRGMSKEKANLDLWLKEVAPSDSLRIWFNHEKEKWSDFQKKYRDELLEKEELLIEMKKIEKEKGTITLLFSARDSEHNNALVLEGLLKKEWL